MQSGQLEDCHICPFVKSIPRIDLAAVKIEKEGVDASENQESLVKEVMGE